MMPGSLFFALALAVTVTLIARHRHRRNRIIDRLAQDRAAFVDTLRPRLAVAAPEPAERRRFADSRLVSVHGFLAPESLMRLRQACLGAEDSAERSFIPMHKQGGTISYEQLHRQAPACIAFYHAHEVRAWLEGLIGVSLVPTPDQDQSSCSLLYYDRAGDHIGWHYDHNFYRGRHFTVLLSLVNGRPDAASDGSNPLSSGRLQRRDQGIVSEVATPENTLVVFEGAHVLHRASPIADGEKRIMLSMTFCTDPHRQALKEVARRIKDTAYFGPRALID
jgi:hypothetical protein